jgi:hypothetical protein
MPTYRVTDPNSGKTLRLTGDSPPTEAELEQIFASQQPAQAPEQPQGQTFGDLMGLALSHANVPLITPALKGAEVAAPIVSGAVAEPVAGIAGLGRTVAGRVMGETGEEAGIAGAETVKKTREALKMEPGTEEARGKLEAIGAVLEPVGEGMKAVENYLGDFAYDITGSPAAAAAAATAPTALLEILGLKGLKSIRKGTRLIDDAGRPTKILRKQLDKRGLDFDDLSPEVRASIPKTAEPGLLPGANLPAKQAERILIEQIKAGGRADSLAPYKVVGGRLDVDPIAKEAIRQGYTQGLVQSVKTAKAGSKAKMRKMLGIMRQIKKSERRALDIRPSDVVGESVMNRFNYIRNQAKAAKRELDTIASTKLAGKSIDSNRITQSFQQSMDDLGVRFIESKPGVIKPNFTGSVISKNKVAQKAVKDAYDLLKEAGPLDALKAHKLKRQLDELIDFRSTPKAGLTRTGKNILKDLRRNLNDSIRAVDKDYAKVNDTLSQSLSAMDDIKDATGTIDLFAEGADRAVGTKMRALLSNQQGRINLENALKNMEETAVNLGGKFGDDIKDLVMFSDALDEKFGSVAKTSFQGQIEQGVKQAAESGVTRAAIRKGAEITSSGTEKLRGVNDFNAFESMSELLK